jgi:hypothetical protein
LGFGFWILDFNISRLNPTNNEQRTKNQNPKPKTRLYRYQLKFALITGLCSFDFGFETAEADGRKQK